MEIQQYHDKHHSGGKIFDLCTMKEVLVQQEDKASSKTWTKDSNGGEVFVESTTMDAVLRDDATFIQNVSQFYNQESLSDVTLRIGKDKYFAHKFVLAKSSDVFRTMLYDDNWKAGVREELELSEAPECQAVFDKFLRYLYSAEVAVSVPTAVGILCLADKYQVGSLKELCIKYMVENSKSPRVQCALDWYSWAKALHLPSLLKQCTRTIAWNYYEIINSNDWLGMEIEFLSDTLQSSELVVPNEYTLWEALSKWLLHESHVHSLGDYCSRLLPLIRFPQMYVPQLFRVEQQELSSRPECTELMCNLLSQAFRFHAVCPHQTQLKIMFQCDTCYLPREYTYLTVDSVRIQNTLRFGIQVDVKMYRGPVPAESREAEWKITYRKQVNNWEIQLYPHETALMNNEANIQPSIIVTDECEKVIQVKCSETLTCTRGHGVFVQIQVENPEQARTMALLIKPIPC